MLLQAMLKDSVDAQKQAQAKIEAELELREQEKAERDSLIAEKIADLYGLNLDEVSKITKNNSLNIFGN